MKTPAPDPLSPAAASTAEELEGVLDGRVPPCRGPHGYLWTSEDRNDLHTAASLCRSLCPALDACLTHTETLKPAWGAWAGRVYRRGHKKRPCPERKAPTMTHALIRPGLPPTPYATELEAHAALVRSGDRAGFVASIGPEDLECLAEHGPAALAVRLLGRCLDVPCPGCPAGPGVACREPASVCPDRLPVAGLIPHPRTTNNGRTHP